MCLNHVAVRHSVNLASSFERFLYKLLFKINITEYMQLKCVYSYRTRVVVGGLEGDTQFFLFVSCVFDYEKLQFCFH